MTMFSKKLNMLKGEKEIADIDFSRFQILKDEKLNQELVQKGYVILPLLSQDEIQSFKEIYARWHTNNKPVQFYKSYYSSNAVYRNEVEKKVFDIWNDRLQKYFHPFELIGGMFVVKPYGKEGHIPPHQDYSLVDESNTWSINSWCPLEDTKEEYGILKILPGSHRFMRTIRGYGIPEHYSHLSEVIEKNFAPIHLKAGECVFFHLSIIHGSSYNLRSDPRVAIGCTILPENAQLVYRMVPDNESKVYKYHVKKEFFINNTHMPEASPDLKRLVETYQPNFIKMSEKQILEKIKSTQIL